MSALLFVALLAVADIPEEHRIEIEGCARTTDGLMCVVSAENLKAYMGKRLEIAKELAELKAAQPKCADVTVTEPSKAPKLPLITRPPKTVPHFTPEGNE